MLEKMQGPDHPPCPRCGCPESAILHERRMRSGAVRQKRICDHCLSAWWHRPDDSEAVPLVVHEEMRCPHCGARDHLVTRTEGDHRHHLCRMCQQRFESVTE